MPKASTRIAAGAIVVAVVVSLISSQPAHGMILLVNPSFELPDIANGAASGGGINGQGWTTPTSTGATFLLDNNTTQTQWFNAAVPHGQQANTLSTNSFMSQQLNDDVTGPVLSAPGLSFNVSFYVGRRKDTFGDNPGAFDVRLQEFNGATFTGINYVLQDYQTDTDAVGTTIDLGVGVGLWQLTPVNLTLTVPANLNGGTVGRNVRLVFVDGVGEEATIDAVSATQVPEPSAAVLLALAVGAASTFRGRRRRSIAGTLH